MMNSVTPESFASQAAIIGKAEIELGQLALKNTQDAKVRSYAERKAAKLGSVAQPLRAALTGKTTSPGIFNVLAVLGREESLARLRDQAAAS